MKPSFKIAGLCALLSMFINPVAASQAVLRQYEWITYSTALESLNPKSCGTQVKFRTANERE